MQPTQPRKPIRKRKTHMPGRLGKWLAMLPATCILLYPLYEAAQLHLKSRTIASPRLPAAFDSLTIVYVTDIHYGALFSRERLERLIARVNELSPDLIVLGGDYAEDSDGALAFFEMLRDMPGFSAGMAVAGVLGNHDRTAPESNLARILAAMEAAGVTPLCNGVLTLRREGATLAIAGVDDYYNGHPELARVAAQAAQADYCIFVPHTPDLLPDAYRALDGARWFDLALCGHTHGGQVTLFGRSVYASSLYGDRYRTGWMHENGADILVSNGVGTSVLPVRLGAPPQFHQITLKTMP